MGHDLEKRPEERSGRRQFLKKTAGAVAGLMIGSTLEKVLPAAAKTNVQKHSENIYHAEQTGTSFFFESAVPRETLETNSDRIAGSTYTVNVNGTVDEFWVLEKRGGSEYSLIRGDSVISKSIFDSQKGKYGKFQQLKLLFLPEENGQLRSIAKNGDNILVSGINTQTGASILNLYNGNEIIDLSERGAIRQYGKVTSIPGSEMFLGDVNGIIHPNPEAGASQVVSIDVKWKTKRITWDQTQDPSFSYAYSVLPLNIETNEFEVFEKSSDSNSSGINYYKINYKTGATIGENISLSTTSKPTRCSGIAIYKDSSLKTHAVTASPNEKKIYDIDMSTENRVAKSVDYGLSLPSANTEIIALQALTLENGKTYILIGGKSKIEGSSPPRYKQIVGSLDLETNTFNWKEFSVNANYAHLNVQDSMQVIKLPNNQHALTYDIFGLGRTIIPISPDGKADVDNITYVALSDKAVSRRDFIPLIFKP